MPSPLLPLGLLVGAALQASAGAKTAPPASPPGLPAARVPAAGGGLRYVALGDSTGVGVGAHGGGYVDRLFGRLRAARPRSTLTNLCRSGATTRELIDHQLPALPTAPAELVTVAVGVNDLARGTPAAVFADRLETIVQKVRRRSRGPVVLANLPDVSLAPAVPAAWREGIAAQVRAFNDVIAQAVARHGLVLFDVFAMSRTMLPAHPELISADGFHPSDAGYELWAERLWKDVVAPAL